MVGILISFRECIYFLRKNTQDVLLTSHPKVLSQRNPRVDLIQDLLQRQSFHWRFQCATPNLAIDHTSRLQHVTQHIPLPKVLGMSRWDGFFYNYQGGIWTLSLESCWYLHAIPYQKASKFSQDAVWSAQGLLIVRNGRGGALNSKKNVQRCFSGMLQ